jgi:hypothetical protein
MKRIKIFTLTLLLMGCIPAFAQQTTAGSQADETGPAIEQADPAAMPASQSPLSQQGEQPSAALTQPQALVPDNVAPVQPVERDETMPPEGEQTENLPQTADPANPAVMVQEIIGPDEATGPVGVKPD